MITARFIPDLKRSRLFAALSCASLLVLLCGCSAQPKPAPPALAANPETPAIRENEQERAGSAEGEKVARELIQHGQVYLQFYWGSLAGRSLVGNTTLNFAEHLRSAFRIECRDVGSSPRTDYERAYAAAFNRVMIAHLETIHGRGFIFKAEEEAAYLLGKIDAEKSLAQGMLAIETMGLPPTSRGAFMDILKKEYGIHVRVTAGSIVNSSLKGHARGFNEVMIAAIEKKFGAGLLTKVEALADAEQLSRAQFDAPLAPAPTASAAASSLLASIALPASSTVITPAMEAEHREIFSKWLEERSPRFYRLGEQRLFTVKLDTFAWGPLAESIGVAVKQAHANAVDDTSWRQPDYFAVRGWQLPDRPGVNLVVSALGELPGKDAYLVGLYEVFLPSLPATDDATRRLAMLSRPSAPPQSSHISEVQNPHIGVLADWLNEYCRGQYTVSGRRYFLVPADGFQWITIDKFFASALHDCRLEATRETFSWHSPGIDLVAVWNTSGPNGKKLAVAALRDPKVNGSIVIGYFELTPANLP